MSDSTGSRQADERSDELTQALTPEKEIKLPSGQSYRIRQLLLVERARMTRLYARLLVGLTVSGDQLTPQLLLDRLPNLLIDTWLAEQEETPEHSDALEFVQLFVRAMTGAILEQFSEADFIALVREVIEFNPLPFDFRRPGVSVEIMRLLEMLQAATPESSPSSDSSTAPALTPASPASPTPTRSSLRKSKRATSAVN